MNFLIDLFMNVLKSEAVEKLAATRIYGWYRKYKEVRQKIGKVKSKYNLLMNPNNWMHALTSLPKNEVNSFFKDLANWKNYYNKPEFKNNPRWMYEDEEVGMPTDEGHQAFKPNEEAKRKLEQMNKELNGGGKWETLSSSWIKRGMWKMMYKTKLLGTLSIETRTSNTIYAYPMVPYDVWVLMKEANGTNGTRNNPRGAGSVFWKYWLDKWLPSMLRRKVKNDLANKKISRDEYNVALDQVQISSKSFYRSNSSKYTKDALNKEWYLSQGKGKGFYTHRYNTYKDLYNTKYTSQYYTTPSYGFTTTIKNATKKRNPDYINKKKQGQINKKAKEDAKRQAQPFRNLLNKKRKLEKMSNYTNHPINSAKNKVKRSIRGIIKKRGKK